MGMFKGDKVGYDRVLLLATLLLLCIGVIIISSASIMESSIKYGDSFYQTKKHLVGVAMALVCGIASVMTPTAVWKKYSIHSLFFILCLMIIVLVVGREINGAKRWLSLGFMNLQPGELLKLVWILYFSDYVSRKIESISKTVSGFLRPMAFIAVMAMLLLMQPDFGSLFVITLITYVIMWMAGVGFLKYIVVMAVLLVIGIVVIKISPYRTRRITSFLDPWSDEFGAGYQLTQSLMAFGRGGWFGEGLGNSYQKLGYLPEAHTDFVTAILGEEFGFVGMLALIALEFLIVAKAFILGFKILKNDAIYQGYVAIGIGAWIAFQTFINIGAASGGLPTKGLTIPFVSYGGSSLIVFSIAVGILLRIDYEWRNKIISTLR